MHDELESRMWLAHHEAFAQWAAALFHPRMNQSPRTLLLSGRDVAGLMTQGDWLEAVETGFRAAADGKAFSPKPMAIEGDGGTFHAKGASLALDRPYVALKLNANFPGNPDRRLPTIQGAILLCDGETGALLAIMDSIEVTLRRTAAASALAARYLARPESRSLFVCGCGAQARAQVAALAAILPIERVVAWDKDPARARTLVADIAKSGLAPSMAESLAAARDCDVIVTCTTSRAPFLDASVVRAGSFVAAVGADSPEKSEIEPALMAQALVVADVFEQCVAMGDLHHALAAGLGVDHVHGELAELVTGAKPGRTSDDQITLFDSTGTALQDVAAAARIFERASKAGRHASVRLGEAA